VGSVVLAAVAALVQRRNPYIHSVEAEA